MYNSDSAPKIIDAMFLDNEATVGGAMFNSGKSAPIITNASFLGNEASEGGGMKNTQESEPTLRNVRFSGNHVTNEGGAMRNSGDSAPRITNVTFHNNQSFRGGAMRNADRANVAIINSIFWENEGSGGEDEIDHGVDEDGAIVISHSIVNMQESDFADSEGEVDVDFESDDPEFADAELRPSAGSPAIDAGDNSVTGDEDFPDVDLDGNPRIVGEAIDLGPYGFQD